MVGGLQPADGGPSYSVPRLCESLAARGQSIPRLGAVAGPDPISMPHTYLLQEFKWDYAGIPAIGSLRLSSDMARTLKRWSEDADVIHNHGLWLAPNLLAGRVAKRARLPLVISPRGMLSPAALRFSAYRKRLMWRLAQSAMLRRAACLHATSHAELQEFRALGLSNPVAVIPNGVDIPSPTPPRAARDRVVLYLGRIHPKKGLLNLLAAWSKVESIRPSWRLRIVGPGEQGHEVELRDAALRFGLARVTVEAPLYGDAKVEAFRAAELFVLPTQNENFGIAVAEALAHGKPVICTQGAPWEGLATERCGWWIEHGPQALTAALLAATAIEGETLRKMGARGREWMQRDFSWDRIAAEMEGVYDWLAGRNAPPSTVSFA